MIKVDKNKDVVKIVDWEFNSGWDRVGGCNIYRGMGKIITQDRSGKDIVYDGAFFADTIGDMLVINSGDCWDDHIQLRKGMFVKFGRAIWKDTDYLYKDDGGHYTLQVCKNIKSK